MTTNAQIRAAWQTKVFSKINSGINCFDYEFWPMSRVLSDKGFFQKRVDFWLYLVRSKTEFNVMSGEDQIFEVEVRRYLENETDKKNYNVVVDDFQTLMGLIKLYLTDDWNNTVDDWQPPTEGPQPVQELFGEVECWRAQQIFTARKLVDY